MPEYYYRGRDGEGKAVSGRVQANDPQGAASELIQRGVIPIEVTEDKPKAAGLRFSLDALRRVQLEDLMLLCRQMYSLAKAGIPVIRAVNNLKESVRCRLLAAALDDIAQELQRGQALSVALHAHPQIFPMLFVAIIHVGENTGRLDQSFLQLSEYFELEIETRKRIRSAMRYPSFVLSAIAAAVVILNVFVIPQFESLFNRFGAELPWPTQVLMATSRFFVEDWWILLLGLGGLWFGVYRYLNTVKGRLSWDRYKLRLPIVGSIIERALLGRFARSFAMMVSSGIAMHQALALVADAVDNQHMAEKLRQMREGIERGESLLRTATRSELFTPLVLQMIEVGEETGRVDLQMNEVAGYYEREVDFDLKSLTAKIEPILIVIVAGLVLVLALGIFLPMWDMMRVMQG